ncbi:hypothetical protein RSAG8_02304, partial [Rhizoctonia solani AG-8 WAC10335]
MLKIISKKGSRTYYRIFKTNQGLFRLPKSFILTTNRIGQIKCLADKQAAPVAQIELQSVNYASSQTPMKLVWTFATR